MFYVYCEERLLFNEVVVSALAVNQVQPLRQFAGSEMDFGSDK